MSPVTIVSHERFCDALALARQENPKIANATSSPEELSRHGIWYLTPDGDAGFGIVPDSGGLVALFNNSATRGLGRELVKAAIGSGAIHLDCFDGFLVGYYRSLGFVETHREPNWTPGGPDVVFMSRPSSTD